MDNRLIFNASAHTNEVTDENEVVSRVNNLKESQQGTNGSLNMLKKAGNNALKDNQGARKPLASKGSNSANPQTQKFGGDKKINFSRPGLKNKKPVMVTHTGSFIVQNNTTNNNNNNSTTNSGYKIQKSLVRQKSLVLNDFEDGNMNSSDKEEEKDDSERQEVMKKLRAVFTHKDQSHSGSDDGYVTEETDSEGEVEDESFSLPSFKSNIRGSSIKNNNLMDLLKTSSKEDALGEDYDEIETAPKREQPLPDGPEGYIKFSHEDIKKLNIFSSPFINLRSSTEKKYYPSENENDSPFKLLPLDSFPDKNDDDKYTIEDIHAPVRKTGSPEKKQDYKEDVSSPISLNFELPEFDGNGLTNDELDSFL